MSPSRGCLPLFMATLASLQRLPTGRSVHTWTRPLAWQQIHGSRHRPTGRCNSSFAVSTGQATFGNASDSGTSRRRNASLPSEHVGYDERLVNDTPWQSTSTARRTGREYTADRKGVTAFFTSRAVGGEDDRALFEDKDEHYESQAPLANSSDMSIERRASDALSELISDEQEGISRATQLLHDLVAAGVRLERRGIFAKAALHTAERGQGTDCLAWLAVCPRLPSPDWLQKSGRLETVAPDVSSEVSPIDLLKVTSLLINQQASTSTITQALQQTVLLGALAFDSNNASPTSHCFGWLLHSFKALRPADGSKWSWEVFQHLVTNSNTCHLEWLKEAEMMPAAAQKDDDKPMSYIPHNHSLRRAQQRLYLYGVNTLLQSGKAEEAAHWFSKTHLFKHDRDRQGDVVILSPLVLLRTWKSLLQTVYVTTTPATIVARRLVAKLSHIIHKRHASMGNILERNGDPDGTLLRQMVRADYYMRDRRRRAQTEGTQHLSPPAQAWGNKYSNQVMTHLRQLHDQTAYMETLELYRKTFDDPFFNVLASQVLDEEQMDRLAVAHKQGAIKFHSHWRARTIMLRSLIALCQHQGAETLANLYLVWLKNAKANMWVPRSKEISELQSLAHIKTQTDMYEDWDDPEYSISQHESTLVELRLHESHGPRVHHFSIFLRALLTQIPKDRLASTDGPSFGEFNALDIIVRILTDIDQVSQYKAALPKIDIWTIILGALAHSSASHNLVRNRSRSDALDSDDLVTEMTWRLATALGMGPASNEKSKAHDGSKPKKVKPRATSKKYAGADTGKSMPRQGMSKSDIGDFVELMSTGQTSQTRRPLLARATPLTYGTFIHGLLQTHDHRPEPLIGEAIRVHSWFLQDKEAQSLLKDRPDLYGEKIEKALSLLDTYSNASHGQDS